MPDPKGLWYFVLPRAEAVQFNNKPDSQRLTGDVNANRDYKKGLCKVMVCHMLKISSDTGEGERKEKF